MADGRVEFEIRADNSDVDSKISDTTNKLKSAAGQWESSTQSAANGASMFSGVLQGVGQMLGGVVMNAAKQAGQALIQFGKDCINAASDFEEVQNVVDTVFGSSAKEIYNWAEQALNSFGLAQTAALKYASTLGAMMKSSGLGMDEVKEMSTTLAGLAADMASFYNLDFDEAFEKIKSGISGQTEPLKALGIDLSAASLEAFRLAQGIDKAYSSMSQAEQIALRYQYIMQATADAQGDFERTSDGYANSIRRIQSAWENIKTILGGPILGVVAEVTNAIAGLLTQLTTTPEKTIFDEVADIDADYEAEIKEIEATAAEARILIETLEKIHTNTAVTDQSTQLANLISSLSTSVPGLYDAIKDKDPSTQIWALAKALSNDGQGISFEAWREALETYGTFSDALEKAMQSENPTESIRALAEELAKGSDIDATTWESILTTFAGALANSNVTTEAGKVEEKIKELSATLSMKDGIPVSAWETAFTYFNGYKKDFFAALDSDDPGKKLDELAKKLSADYPTLSVETWRDILTELSGYLSSADSEMDVSGIIEKISGMESTFSGLAETMSQKSGIDVSKWKTAFDDFGTYKNDFFSALSSDDPGGKLDELAEKLSAKYDDMSVEDWQGIFTTLQGYLTEADSNLDTGGILSKLSGLSDSLSASTGISAANWEQAFSDFEGYRDEFFTALGSNDPGAELDKLAAKLSAQYPDMSVETWKGILGTLSTYLTQEDANLNVQGIIDKLTGLTEAVTGASDIKLGNLLQTIEDDAGTKSTNVDAWSAILGTFSARITGFGDALGKYNGGSSQKIRELASALSGIDGDEAKVSAWKELVQLLVSNADEIQAIMGWTAEDTWGWMTSLLDSVNELNPANAAAFEKIFNALLGDENKKGLGDMEVPDNVVSSFNGLTSAMDSTYYASAQELEVLKRLMQLYPQLSQIVDINTGEIRGGIEALQDYVDEVEATRIKLAMQEKIKAKEEVLFEHQKTFWQMEAELSINTADLDLAQKRAENLKSTLLAIAKDMNDQGRFGLHYTDEYLESMIGLDYFWRDIADEVDLGNYADMMNGIEFRGVDTVMDLASAYNDQLTIIEELTVASDDLREKIDYEREAIDYEREALIEEADALGVSTSAKDANADATAQVTMAEEDAAKALTYLKSLLQDIVNYQDNVRQSVLGTISQAVDGLKELDRTTDEYRKSISGNNLIKNLNDQLAFLEEYSRLIDEARAKGVTDEVLAAVADGSVESMQYLRGLATATSDEVKAINDRFGEVTAKKGDLADKLTAQKLAVDEVYQEMIKKAEEAALAMDQSAVAGAGATATMEAVVAAVAGGRASLQSEVDTILALMAQIGTVGGYTVWGTSGGIIGTGGARVGRAAGAYATPHALGLDYVPYDGYLAELHQGETVLTADEAAIWRNFTGASEAAGQQAFDYDMIGSMISSIPSGGNVYLDGQTVGRLISQGQGESYRRLQRSGWRG